MEMDNKDSKPLFSVIVPVYNVCNYLDRCMDSLLGQDFTSYEIILVDDGSTDGSSELCDSYGKKDRIHVVHKENGGLSSARNAGMDCMSGQYVLFVDSDDWIDKSTLKILYNAIQNDAEEPVDIIKYNYIRHEDEIKTCTSSANSGIYTGEEVNDLITLALCGSQYCLSVTTHSYRVEFIRENNIRFVSEREVGSEDYLFNIQLIFHAKCIVVLDDALYHYYCRPGSLTQRYRRNLPEQYTVLFKNLVKYMKKIGVYNRYISQVSYFYVWSLMYSTCLVNEYSVTNEHSLKAGRKRVHEYLRFKEFKFAAKMSCKEQLTLKKKVQMMAMVGGIEPLFYYLFYLKPLKKKG